VQPILGGDKKRQACQGAHSSSRSPTPTTCIHAL
jgi:hypothetical protein